tara:strand:+ start:262 stop:570 length:309 start_codon:yes stop_codon:yes gene_type:complete
MDWIGTALAVGKMFFKPKGGSGSSQSLGPADYLITEDQMARETDASGEALKQTAKMGEFRRNKETEKFYKEVLAPYGIEDETGFNYLVNLLNEKTTETTLSA